ncbi:signal peptidase I [Peribacillus sp. SCS-37]|uniref:signal peptidase I n=1 Tax=Paraperibacillus esterisolvens TaxID=3115296 RepID=UPI0039064AF8
MSAEVKKEIISWLKTIAFSIILVVIIKQFLFTPVTVKGDSMIPTFHDSNRIIVTKWNKIHRFDMVVFHAPDKKEDYIKRVIGLPGDKIEAKHDVLYINGKKYKEGYVNKNKADSFLGDEITGTFTMTVPKGKLFVMGDNRGNSTDSRIFGPIEEDSVIGKVQFRFYPLDEVGVPK